MLFTVVRTVVAMLSRSTIVSNILSYVHLSTNLLISHHLLVPCLLHTLQSSTRLYLLSQLVTAKVAVVVNSVLVERQETHALYGVTVTWENLVRTVGMTQAKVATRSAIHQTNHPLLHHFVHHYLLCLTPVQRKFLYHLHRLLLR